ncbi:MAG: radical SAM protein [Candidatus Aminicenantes bacterium]|nr:radical SAM protein [Candidatus Aminicenantes bacterium]
MAKKDIPKGKILLVRPPLTLRVARAFHSFLHLEPLDLELVAGGISRDHETRIIDLTLSRTADTELQAVLRDFRPAVVGFGGYSNQAVHVKRLAALAKAELPGVMTVVGGVHATTMPLDFQLPGIIDVVVRGDGGTAMRRLLPRLLAGEPLLPDGGILPTSSTDFATLASEPPPPLPDYSEVPWPRRDLVRRGDYFCVWSGAPGDAVKTIFPQVATLRTSTGCPHRCAFCVVHYLANGKYLQRTPEDVVAEIAAVPENHIYFVDDEMFINVERTTAIAKLLLERGIRKHYVSWARSDTICKHPDLFRLWRRAGLDSLYVGLESMESENLQGYNKGVDPEINRKAVAVLAEIGITLHAALMVNPDFEAEDFIAVRRMINEIAPAEVTITVFGPPPGTALWRQHEKEFICPDPCAFYDSMHTILPTRVPLKRFYRYFSLLYLFGFRIHPNRRRRHRPPLRDLLRTFAAGTRVGYALRTIYKEYDRKLW